ncbi:histidinol-phosphate transaminase [Salisaeta longa]|uniref:histidinol-phosphate transaminase n=1 Tax=Salisaeta longa TaxID=503170 RepID=UPI00040DF0D0|nr:histidinol-phosphate transaminase [Salisaeta longa]
MATSAPSSSVDDVLRHVRSAVRNEKAYVVGAPSRAEVKLNQNESPYDLPADVRDELHEHLAALQANRYPAEQPHQLCAALAEAHGITPEHILVGNGSNELTYTFGLCFIDPGTPVVLPRPMFSLYEKVAHLYGADLTSVGPRDDLSFDTDALVDAVQRTGAAFTVLTSPNNPTGLAMPLAEIERVVDAAPGIVVVDEAYVEFNPEGSALSLLDAHPNVVIMRTFSKAYGLAGLRLGYIMAHPRLVREVTKSRLPFMVDRLAEAAGLALLERPALIAERVEQMKDSCARLTEALAARSGVTVVPSQANFVLFEPPGEATRLQERLADRGVLVRNMGGYASLAGFLRVAAGTPAENKAFLEALDDALHERGA